MLPSCTEVLVPSPCTAAFARGVGFLSGSPTSKAPRAHLCWARLSSPALPAGCSVDVRQCSLLHWPWEGCSVGMCPLSRADISALFRDQAPSHSSEQDVYPFLNLAWEANTPALSPTG